MKRVAESIATLLVLVALVFGVPIAFNAWLAYEAACSTPIPCGGCVRDPECW